MFDIKKFSKIQLGLASPEEIESWALDKEGNPLPVTKAETVNYRTQKPERDGLFCERIFGPAHDYECACGRYKKKAYAGTVCEKCGVECTTKSVRRERMSFINLEAPVTHIWYLKGVPSRIALLLSIEPNKDNSIDESKKSKDRIVPRDYVNPKDLEEVVYFVSHIVINSGNCKFLSKCEVLDEQKAKEKFKAILVDLLETNTVVSGTIDYQYVQEAIAETEDSQSFDFETTAKLIQKFYPGVKFGIGAEAVQELLSLVDVDKEFDLVMEEYNSLKDKSSPKKAKLQKRLETLKAFKESKNKPEWMVLTKLPVIPPDLRPMLPLDGSRIASADLNDLYKRVIQRNDVVHKMKTVQAPSVMINNAKRMLQEAVDALFDNGRRTKSVQNQNGRPLKSLSGALKGKQGRFRQNLLGKRVDYSGRSVIAVGPDLKMDECGLPREMAIQLFRPFVARKLVEEGIASNTKHAESEFIDKNAPEAWAALREVVKNHPVLLNRAPTLHRLGIQAYHPKLVEGRAIRLFPLACTAFNADFDGDQMAVHVPLSNEAIWEAENLMLGNRNILYPISGKPIVTPSKDMVLGNYYLTIEESADDFIRQAEEAFNLKDYAKAERYKLYARSEGKVFSDENEVIVAYDTRQVHLHNRIAIRGEGLHNLTFSEEQNKSYLVTTVGKVIFNRIFDKNFPFLNGTKKEDFIATPDKYFIKPGENIKEIIASMPLNKPFKKDDLGNIINEFLKKSGVVATSEMLNKMKDQGFKYATKSAVTVSLYDIVDIEDKEQIFKDTESKVNQLQEDYDEGLTTEAERHKAVVDLWSNVTRDIRDKVGNKFSENKNNPFYLMSDSGASGKKDNFNQMAGLKGLMQKPNGDTIELPIKSSFKEGLSVSEFFNSTHGTRKGGADAALKTADSGYLTRKLVYAGQYAIVKEEDCGTNEGTIVKKLIDDNDGSTVIEEFKPRLVGRYTLKDVIDENGVVVVKADTLITEAMADDIINHNITEVEIRSIFGCKCHDGVCQKCYGINLANNELVKIGEAVGVMAAQSIGEPGTQLTLRNFNNGGLAGANDITTGLPRVDELFGASNPKGAAKISEVDGTILSITESDGRYKIVIRSDNVENKNDKQEYEYETPFNAKLANALDDKGQLIIPVRPLKKGDYVRRGQNLSQGPVSPKELLSITNDVKVVQNYILKEIQKVYYPVQGIVLNDKHIEIIIKSLFSKVIVEDPGETNLIPGQKVSLDELNSANKIALINGKTGAKARPIILGITKANREVDSWLSAASFQETTKVLTDATINGKTDNLKGLKENIIVGKLIPAGTGLLEPRFATNKTVEE